MHAAKINKRDEFYTQYADIENEMVLYRDYFDGASVFSNCDDPVTSNFAKYFNRNFKELNLAWYAASGFSTEPTRRPASIGLRPQAGQAMGTLTLDDAGYRDTYPSIYCRQADIIVTNPPFSQFLDFFHFIKHKKFLILGNLNAATYKDIFPFFKDGSTWFGDLHKSIQFEVPADYPHVDWVNEDGMAIKKVAVRWFTNMKPAARTKIWSPNGRTYDPDKYPQYDNFYAIEVSRINDIPLDYYGVMGVPITFLDYGFDQSQFEIVDYIRHNTTLRKPECRTYSEGIVNDKAVYDRILIRKGNQ